MKKRKFRNLDLNSIKIASLNKLNSITGGDDDSTFEETCQGQGQTNGKTASKVVRNCTIIGSEKNCLSDDC